MADCIISHLDTLLSGDIPDAIVPHTLPAPECACVREGAELVPVTELDGIVSDGFELKDAPSSERFPKYLATGSRTASLEFEFDGSCLGFTWIDGYISCDATVSIDGDEPVRVRSWDHALRSFHRIQNALFAPHLESGHHKARLTLDASADGDEIFGITGIFLCR